MRELTHAEADVLKQFRRRITEANNTMADISSVTRRLCGHLTSNKNKCPVCKLWKKFCDLSFLTSSVASDLDFYLERVPQVEFKRRKRES